MNQDIFLYKGYELPKDSVILTGGGVETWEQIALGHMDQYARYAPIDPIHRVVEMGCGVGRDAIELTERLSTAGEYIGIDIIHASIQWCQRNISPKYPNFTFTYFDVHSQIHNPEGTLKTADVRIPTKGNSVDRIILQSVFTHMFEEDITHYLKEFNRVLKDDGLVVASIFITDEESLKLARESFDPNYPHKPLKFEHHYGPAENGCYINDEQYPEGAVGYTPEALNRMLEASQMELVGDVHRGQWCGRKDVFDGQDMLVLRKKQ